MDGQGRAVELTADFSSFLASYDMADVQAYPVPQGIRVEVYSRYGYETGASHTYPAAELKQRLAAAQPGAFRPELLRVAGNGKLLLGQARSGATGWRTFTQPTASPGKRRRGCRRAGCYPTTARAL